MLENDSHLNCLCVMARLIEALAIYKCVNLCMFAFICISFCLSMENLTSLCLYANVS